jgi:hypothetical protein
MVISFVLSGIENLGIFSYYRECLDCRYWLLYVRVALLSTGNYQSDRVDLESTNMTN